MLLLRKRVLKKVRVGALAQKRGLKKLVLLLRKRTEGPEKGHI